MLWCATWSRHVPKDIDCKGILSLTLTQSMIKIIPFESGRLQELPQNALPRLESAGPGLVLSLGSCSTVWRANDRLSGLLALRIDFNRKNGTADHPVYLRKTLVGHKMQKHRSTGHAVALEGCHTLPGLPEDNQVPSRHCCLCLAWVPHLLHRLPDDWRHAHAPNP